MITNERVKVCLRNVYKSGQITFSFVSFGTASGLLCFWINKIVNMFRMWTNVLSHAQVAAVDLIRISSIIQMNNHKKCDRCCTISQTNHVLLSSKIGSLKMKSAIFAFSIMWPCLMNFVWRLFLFTSTFLQQ